MSPDGRWRPEPALAAPALAPAPARVCRHIVANVDDAAAGPSYSVLALVAALRAQGMDAEAWAVGQRAAHPGLRIFPPDGGMLRRLGASSALASALRHFPGGVGGAGPVLHGHGLWLLPNLYPARVARRHGVPLVVSPRGMLGAEALAFSPHRKRVMWALAQGRALRTAACFHATSDAEAEDIRRAGLAAPIAVIPNGIDLPGAEPARARPESRTVLHLGRLHPKKGVDRLVAAWARVARKYPAWQLRIVGPSELGTRAALERQVRALAVPRVTFDGPLHGAAKAAAYREAGLFVLPTRGENFGMVVAEALAAGVPVISTRGAPWAGLEAERCGWWVDHGPVPLATALDAALSLPPGTRAGMGARGRAWMARDFGWDGIAARMAEVYAWLVAGRAEGQGPRPACVRL